MHKTPKILFILLLLTACLNVWGEEREIDVLFVGNSYTYVNNLPQTLSAMAEAKGAKLNALRSTAGGATLEDHFKGNKNLKTLQTIQEGDYDFIILQEQSLMPALRPEKTLQYAAQICALIEDEKTTACFFLTWARENDPPMQEKLNATYFKAAKDNGAIVIPVGLAWQKTRKKHPELKLFKKDGSHPSPLGTYLSACVFLKTLTGQNPVGLPRKLTTLGKNKEPITLISLEADEARLVQKIAAETVEEFQAKMRTSLQKEN